MKELHTYRSSIEKIGLLVIVEPTSTRPWKEMFSLDCSYLQNVTDYTLKTNCLYSSIIDKENVKELLIVQSFK